MRVHYSILLLTSIVVAAYPSIPNTTWKINFGQTTPPPLLQKPIDIVQVGDAEVRRPGIWSYKDAIIQSSLCKKFGCIPMATPDQDNRYRLYAIEDNKQAEEYRFQAGLKVSTEPSGKIRSMNLMLPPRPETGLTNWDIQLIDSVFRTFTGKAPDMTALKACYKVRIKDLREPCPIQKWIINNIKYRTSTEFIYLETVPAQLKLKNPRPDLRNFSIYVLLDQ